MSETFDQICEEIRNDPELGKKLENECMRIAEAKEAFNDADMFMKAVKNVMGKDVTMSDLEKARAEVVELSDSEMEQVTGGRREFSGRQRHLRDQLFGSDEWCWGDERCYTVYKHPDDQDKEKACLFDFLCIFNNNNDCSGIAFF